MNILLVDNGTSYLSHIIHLLEGHSVETLSFENLTNNYLKYDLIVLSGGHSVLINKKNDKILQREIDLILTASKPIIGICYGAELINYAYGGESKSIEKVKGIRQIQKIKDDSIFMQLDIRNFEVFENHGFAITKLPYQLVALAKSNSGYEIFKHRTKPIIGMQFHPEMFIEITLGDELFLNSIKVLSSNPVH